MNGVNNNNNHIYVNNNNNINSINNLIKVLKPKKKVNLNLFPTFLLNKNIYFSLFINLKIKIISLFFIIRSLKKFIYFFYLLKLIIKIVKFKKYSYIRI